MKRLGVFLLPLGRILVHFRISPSIEFADTHLYTWVERCTRRVKCLAQEQNTTPRLHVTIMGVMENRLVTRLQFARLISRATRVATRSAILAQRVLMNFMAKVVPPIRVIPQIHSNSDGILILRVVDPTFLNPVGSKLQKQALKGSSATNVAVMDVSWYVMEYALVAQGHCLRASMWARSSMESLSVFEIPWSFVTDKVSKFPKTPRPDPTPGPAAATFDYMMVLVVVHLVNKPVSDVWSTPGNGRVILVTAFTSL